MTDPNADLADIRQKWLAFCSHDIGAADDFPFEFGVRGEGMAVTQPYPCICPTEDHRPVIAALVTEVETLRAEVARLAANGQCGNVAPDLILGMSSGATCTLRAGHLGWHEDGDMKSKWTYGAHTCPDVYPEVTR